MTIAALVIALLACAFIFFIGGRFIVAPRPAVAGFGVPEDRPRAMTNAKGIRDITSGVVMLVVLAVAGQHALGWALLAVAITPIGDAITVATNGGRLSYAILVHGITAALLIAAGLILALG
jgi:hypothetical protein